MLGTVMKWKWDREIGFFCFCAVERWFCKITEICLFTVCYWDKRGRGVWVGPISLHTNTIQCKQTTVHHPTTSSGNTEMTWLPGPNGHISRPFSFPFNSLFFVFFFLLLQAFNSLIAHPIGSLITKCNVCFYLLWLLGLCPLNNFFRQRYILY